MVRQGQDGELKDCQNALGGLGVTQVLEEAGFHWEDRGILRQGVDQVKPARGERIAVENEAQGEACADAFLNQPDALCQEGIVLPAAARLAEQAVHQLDVRVLRGGDQVVDGCGSFWMM